MTPLDTAFHASSVIIRNHNAYYQEDFTVRYNQLPVLTMAAENLSQLEESVLPELATLLVEHNFHEQFNIWLAHRHFQLTNEHDRIVELGSEQLSVSSIFKDGEPDTALLHRYGLGMPEDATIVPDTFLSHDGCLVPVEYICLERNQAESHVYTTASVTKSFLNEWNEVLVHHGVMDRFGLVVRAHTTSETPKLQLCDSSLRVDITLDSMDCLDSVLNFPGDREIISSVCGLGVPAVWEVSEMRSGMPISIVRERRCWDVWTCAYCGHANGGEQGACANCGEGR